MPEETPLPPNESSTCPSPEELASYADLTLTGARRREVRQHLRTCQGCSRAVLAMQRALSPIRDRHQGGGGWRGPWESATGTLPEDVAPAWEEHLKHCNRCLARTQLLTVRKPVLALGGATFASGLAVALLLTPMLRPAPSIERVPKSTEVNTTGLPGGVPALLKRYLNPSDTQLTRMIDAWEEVRKVEPENPAVYAALLPLYKRVANRESDPKRKAELTAYIDQLKTRCQELVR